MDEARLSPDLGRMIDAAKTAARSLGSEDPSVEGVALLDDKGAIHTGAASGRGEQAVAGSSAEPFRSAASVALQHAQEAGTGEILAAAVAAPFDTADTVVPGAATHECLVGLDPELPLVMKQRGRWVMVAVDTVTPSR